jgi:hypothetical protein
MKNNIFKSLFIFLILFIAIFIYLNRVFASKHHFKNTTEDFKELASKTNIDVVLYGSSHTYTAYNPLVLNFNSKTISFNLGSDALKIANTDLLLKESLKYTSPKLVILEIYSPTLLPSKTIKDKGYQLRAFDFVSNYSIMKHKKIIRGFDLNEYLNVMFPLIRNHNNWSSVNYFNTSRRKDLDPNVNYYYNGFIGSRNIVIEEDKLKYKDFLTKIQSVYSSYESINEQGKTDIISFIKIAQKNGSDVLIISSPDLRAKFWNYDFFNELKEITDSFNVPFLNLNDYYNQMELTINDFKDNSHLNTIGSIKASEFLSDYINNNYTLPDRSLDLELFQNNEKYNEFIELYNDSNDYEFNRILNKNLNTTIGIESVNFKKNIKNTLSLSIKMIDNDNYLNDKKRYKLAIHIYPKKEFNHQLNKSNVEKGRLYDQENIELSNYSNSIDFTTNSKIDKIQKIEFFLYKVSGYDGIIGEKVIINVN